MELKDQVNSWEQGLRLHELGVKKNTSFFQWMEVIVGGDGNPKVWTIFRPNTGEYDWMAVTSIHPDVDGEGFETARECCAFSVAELGEMLPDMLITNLQYELVSIKEDDCWLIRYVRNNNMTDQHPDVIGKAEKTEAQARAAMLIYLLENKLITPHS